MALDFTYDENLMNNLFFQTLQKDFSEILLKAIAQKCVICVPKADSITKYFLTSEDFSDHILIPTNDFSNSHFINLCGVQIKIGKDTLTVHHKIKCQTTIQILFHETFYTKDGLKYEVLCVERPLNENPAYDKDNNNGVALKNFGDCLDFLKRECGGCKTLESLDKEIKKFFKKVNLSAFDELKAIQKLLNNLNLKCLQIVFKNSNIKKNLNLKKNYVKNLEIAVGNYWQYSAHKEIIKAITLCTEEDDARLNKAIRNYSTICYQECKTKCKFFSNITEAKLILLKINNCLTTFEKLNCLKQTILTLSECKGEKILINADELLEALSFLILKTNLANWNAQLKFLKLFYQTQNEIFDENIYIITSLEAAISYIQNEIFCKLKSDCYEVDYSDNSFENNSLPLLHNSIENESFKKQTIHQLFHYVALGDLANVKKIIENGDGIDTPKEMDLLNLCDPLCLCDKCSSSFKNDNSVINFFDVQGLTALHVASMYNVPQVVEYLLSQGANANVSDRYGRSPAHYAALKGDQNALLLLLYGNADINALDDSFNSPLHLCSNNGHENCVKALVYYSEYSDAKLEVNQQNVNGEIPLHHAAKWGYQNVVRILLESGSDPTIMNKDKLTPIDVAYSEKVLQLMKNKSLAVEHYIKIKPEKVAFDEEKAKKREDLKNQIYKGVMLKTEEGIKKTEKLLKAVEVGDVNLVSFYMGFDNASTNDSFVQVNQKDFDSKIKNTVKCHPLCACEKCLFSECNNDWDANNVERSSLSKSEKLNVNICNAEGYTPLHLASKKGIVDLVKKFIQNGASLNVQTSDTLQTPLMMACECQKVEAANALLKSGCNVDMQDHRLNTALHYACRTGNIKLVKTLLKYEPDIKLRNIENKTAVQETGDPLIIAIMNTVNKNQALD